MNRSLTSLALVLAPICSFAQSNTNNCMGQDRAEDYFAVVQQYLASSATSYWTKADCKLIAPIWTGDDAKGQLFTPLWQGIGAAIEDWVPSVPPGTEVKGTVRIDWDKAANTVTTTLKVINVPVNPPVRRIDGGCQGKF